MTFYLPILILNRHAMLLGKQQWIHRISLAAQHSAPKFLSASFVFCIAMLLAAVNIFAQTATNMHTSPKAPS